MVLFVDQFEEIFTQISREPERIAFLEMLICAGTVENSRIILLFAMRSDFIANCAAYPRLNSILNRQFIQISAMQPDELVNAIARPALRMGLKIDPDLIAQIINDMQGEPGVLPLMQFALKNLYDSHQKKGGVFALTRDDYLQQGGIHKPLERYADNVFSKLSAQEQKSAHSIFSGLIEVGRGTQDTRRTAYIHELIPANTQVNVIKTLIQKLADARLIVTNEDAGEITVTLSHEKLIDAWPWLKKIVNENRDAISLQNQIKTDANEWIKHNRDSSYLYTGVRLANAYEQLKSNKLLLNRTALEYIHASKTRQNRRWLISIGTVLGIIGILLLAVIVISNQSRKNALLAQQNEMIATTAQAASTLAVAKADEAQRQKNIVFARQLAAQANAIYATGNAKQEVAVLLSALSMKIFPVFDSAQILQTNTLAYPVASMTYENGIRSVSFSADGKYMVSGSYDGSVRIWSVNTNAVLAHLLHDGAVYTVAISPDSSYVVSGSWDGTARVWEIASGREVARMTHEGAVYSVRFSPDSKYVVSGSCDVIYIDTSKNETENNGGYCIRGSARVWESLTGKEVSRMTHEGAVSSVVFSPNGKYVVSGSCDRHDNEGFCTIGSARIWEPITGKESTRMIQNDFISSIAISTDGRYIVTGSWDGTARVCDLPPKN